MVILQNILWRKKLKGGVEEETKHKSNSSHGLFPATSFSFNHYSSLVLS